MALLKYAYKLKNPMRPAFQILIDKQVTWFHFSFAKGKFINLSSPYIVPNHVNNVELSYSIECTIQMRKILIPLNFIEIILYSIWYTNCSYFMLI